MDELEIAKEHQQIWDLAKSNQHRIDDLEKEQKELRNLTNAVSQMVTEQKNMREDLSEMKDDIKELKEKPAKKWDNTADKIWSVIIGAVVAFMLAKIGL